MGRKGSRPIIGSNLRRRFSGPGGIQYHLIVGPDLLKSASPIAGVNESQSSTAGEAHSPGTNICCSTIVTDFPQSQIILLSIIHLVTIRMMAGPRIFLSSFFRCPDLPNRLMEVAVIMKGVSLFFIGQLREKLAIAAYCKLLDWTRSLGSVRRSCLLGSLTALVGNYYGPIHPWMNRTKVLVGPRFAERK